MSCTEYWHNLDWGGDLDTMPIWDPWVYLSRYEYVYCINGSIWIQDISEYETCDYAGDIDRALISGVEVALTEHANEDLCGLDE